MTAAVKRLESSTPCVHLVKMCCQTMQKASWGVNWDHVESYSRVISYYRLRTPNSKVIKVLNFREFQVLDSQTKDVQS